MLNRQQVLRSRQHAGTGQPISIPRIMPPEIALVAQRNPKGLAAARINVEAAQQQPASDSHVCRSCDQLQQGLEASEGFESA